MLTPRLCAPCPTQRNSSIRYRVVVCGRVSPGDQGTAARASPAMCPLAVAVIVAVVFAVAVAVAFAVPAAAADADAAEVVGAGGVASGTAARAEGRDRCCTKNIM